MEGLILASKAMRAAHQQVVNAASRGARVLLLIGPSGSGKEGLARCFHASTGRSGPLVALNSSMFNKDLLRAELFGAEEGAYTGCFRRVIGAVERAHLGTLFLDEIGEIAPEVQPMLLRFLDCGEYERLGGYGVPRTSGARVVCATNKNLRTASAKGEFRHDLWYRLSVHTVEVPPLRARPDDIVAYLRSRWVTGGVTAHDLLTPEAIELLTTHAWQGNFRELANFVERLPADNDRINADDCRRILVDIAIDPSCVFGVREGEATWSQLAGAAMRAFAEDRARETPGTWDEVKEYVEKYFKPLLFAHLTGVSAVERRDAVDIQQVANRLEADRGTAVKQVNRYFERFVK